MAPDFSIDPSKFDVSVRPADDFFGYVNGRWLGENPIPEEESQWGAFSILRVLVERQLKAILDDLENVPPAAEGSPARKVRDFYLTAMDAEKCNAAGLAPLGDIFAKIDGIRDAASLSSALSFLHRNGVDAFWAPVSAQDEKDTEKMAFYAYQGGLGLPDREYYLGEDEKSRAIRVKYLSYMRAMIGNAGADPAMAERVMEIETRLARASDTRVELRDPERQYHKFSPADAAKLAPSLRWEDYFGGISLPVPEYFIIGQPKFMEEAGRLLESVAPDEMRAYLRWHAVNGLAPFLTEELERLRFDFYNANFVGAKGMRPRWRRVLSVMSSAMEDAVGQLYVARHFSAEAKRRVNELVENLTDAYRARIEKLDWMSGATKERALAKLAAVSRKLGYPDQWKDFSRLEIGISSYAENYLAAHAFEFDRQMEKIGGPVDRAEWYMYPQEVNACYQPTMNEILFPAAILQPPFFDVNADDAANYGGIGTVIGHELTHGFDDQGSQYDAKGNLAAWWTPEDRARFDAHAARLAAQFDAYEPLAGVHINGKLTLGENIADLGGLLVAYDGLKIARASRARRDGGAAAPPSAAAAPESPAGGFTPEQRFFANYAITERSHTREELLRLKLQIDPHSPSRFRVNGPASNMKEFYEAFGVSEGDALWRKPEDRAEIW